MFTLIKKTSVHKDTKVVSNQKYDAILGRIYTISHLLSLERLNRISKNPRHVKSFFRGDFLEAILHCIDTFIAVARFEGAVKTVTASLPHSTLLNFGMHHCRERACPFRMLWFHRHRNRIVGNGFIRSVLLHLPTQLIQRYAVKVSTLSSPCGA